MTDQEKDSRAAWLHSQLKDNARLFRAGKIGRAEHDAVLDFGWKLAREEMGVTARLNALFVAEDIAAEEAAFL